MTGSLNNILRNTEQAKVQPPCQLWRLPHLTDDPTHYNIMSKIPPPVTIGLPVYNGEAYLAGALDSLLAQTYCDFELILSDNASTDSTREICREYAARDKRIRYIRQPKNLGAIVNFNRVFELSKSPYFKWAAHDDLCDPSYLSRCIELLEDHPEAAWCHCRSSHIDSTGQLLGDSDLLNVSYISRSAATAKKRFRSVLLEEGGCLDCYGVMRSEIVRKTPLYLSCYGAEKVFIAEMSLRGRYVEVPETLFFARVHQQGSGCIETASGQHEYMCAKKSPRWQFTRLRLLLGHLDAVRRSPLSPGEKAACLLVVGRYLFQVEKWGRILSTSLSGRGIGGGNVKRLRRVQQAAEPSEAQA